MILSLSKEFIERKNYSSPKTNDIVLECVTKDEMSKVYDILIHVERKWNSGHIMNKKDDYYTRFYQNMSTEIVYFSIDGRVSIVSKRDSNPRQSMRDASVYNNGDEVHFLSAKDFISAVGELGIVVFDPVGWLVMYEGQECEVLSEVVSLIDKKQLVRINKDNKIVSVGDLQFIKKKESDNNE